MQLELIAQSQERDFWIQWSPGEQYLFWGTPLVLQETKAEHSSGTSRYSPGVQDSGISNEVVVEVEVVVVIVVVVLGVIVVVSILSLVSKSSKPSGTKIEITNKW